MCAADTEVVHAACAAEADVSGAVDFVVTQAVRTWQCAGGYRLREGVVGVGRGGPVGGPVWALLVVVVGEFVELAL